MTKREGYLGLRLTLAEREAVEECAEREKRSSVSDMARLLIAEALEARRLAGSEQAAVAGRARPERETEQGTEIVQGRPLRSARQDCPPEGFTPQAPDSPRCICGLTIKHHLGGAR